MPSEDSVPTDASTVHRSGDVPTVEPIELEGSPEVIAQAKTVIRGSSRAQHPSERPTGLNQTPAEVSKVLLGQRLNHFRLDKLIGGGGMGAVFRAHDEQLDRTVAIKVIPFVHGDPDLQRRFRNEAQSAAKLDHPRIARVFDVGSQDDWHYIVFEYIEGTNVRDWVHRKGVLSIDEAVYYTCQLADALQHASERGIVHRDIKPSNVLIGTTGKLKLVDMGLARSDALDLSEDMTASGVTLGTFDYISPEQARDPRDADLRSDLYSLGCTLYFMVTGQPPYPGGTMLQKLLSHGNSPPPDPAELRPEVSDNLVAVMQKMLAKNPADRYQTATDLIADLREVAVRDGLRRSQSLGPITIAQPHGFVQWFEKHAPWVVAAMLLVLIAGWLHLDAAANRQELTVPASASRPISGPLVSANSTSTTNPSGDEPIPQLPRPGEAGSGELVARADSRDADSRGSDSRASDSGNSETGDSERGRSELQDSETGSEPPESSGVDATESTGQPGVDAGSTGPLQGSEAEGSDPDSESAEAAESVEPTMENPSDAFAPPSIIRIVAPELMSTERQEGVALSSSLTEALDLAVTHGVDRIEVATETLITGPIKLPRDLLLTSIVPGGSRIILVSAEPRSMERTRMLTIGEHQVEFEDLHFVWTVPSREFEGGTLFEIHDNQLVRLTDCTVTVNNPTLNDEVYAFEIVSDPDKLSRERRDEMVDYPKTWMEFNNVIVRGQMTMLQMDYACQLTLYWDNGLLAVTDRMIDTAGARRALPTGADPILLSLSYVTVHAPMGIMRTRVGVSGSHVVPVDRFSRKCVFWVDPSLPHFEFLGIPSLDDAGSLLRLRGTSNAYDVESTLADPLLRLFAADGDMSVTRMNDLVNSPPDWADDLGPSWEVNWTRQTIADIPANERVAADYTQNDLSPAGFAASALPQFPAETVITADPPETSPPSDPTEL